MRALRLPRNRLLRQRPPLPRNRRLLRRRLHNRKPTVGQAPSAIARVVGEPDIVSSPPPAPGQPEPAEQAEPAGPLSPLVRKMARENNIDLSRVKGTGAGGRITKQDVEQFLSQQQAAPRQPAAPPPAPAKPAAAAPQAPSAPVQTPPAYSPPAAPSQAKVRVEPMSAMRLKIAEHMVMSKRTSAHVTTIHKVDMTKVARVRERQKTDFQTRYGISLTYLPFVVAPRSKGCAPIPS